MQNFHRLKIKQNWHQSPRKCYICTVVWWGEPGQRRMAEKSPTQFQREVTPHLPKERGALQPWLILVWQVGFPDHCCPEDSTKPTARAWTGDRSHGLHILLSWQSFWLPWIFSRLLRLPRSDQLVLMYYDCFEISNLLYHRLLCKVFGPYIDGVWKEEFLLKTEVLTK